MHIVVGFLVAAGSILWALNRLQANGLDLNAFNPFTWFRRNKWKQKQGAKALHSVENPMEVAGMFIVGIAALEGEITLEQRNYIFSVFTDEFGVSNDAAGELYASASYLLKDEIDLSGQVRHIIAPCRTKFDENMVSSLLAYMNKVANFDGEASAFQMSLISAVERDFSTLEQTNSKWS